MPSASTSWAISWVAVPLRSVNGGGRWTGWLTTRLYRRRSGVAGDDADEGKFAESVGDIHAGRATVDEPNALGNLAVSEQTNEYRPRGIIAAQEQRIINALLDEQDSVLTWLAGVFGLAPQLDTLFQVIVALSPVFAGLYVNYASNQGVYRWANRKNMPIVGFARTPQNVLWSTGTRLQ